MKKSDISIVAGLVLAIFLTAMADFSHTAENIRSQTLRLHIIANTDSAYDQQVKLAVKDRIASLCSEICCPAQNLPRAVQRTADNMEYIKQAADSTLQQWGADYSAQCTIEDFYFDTTEYTDFTLPAGTYKALTVRLGNAEGKNWWCVAYPALCTSVRAEYEDDVSNTFIETDTFRIKFKVVELIQDIKRCFAPSPARYNNLP